MYLSTIDILGDNNVLRTLFWVVFGSFIVYLAKECYITFRILWMIGKFPRPPVSSWLWGDWELLTQPTVVDEFNRSDYFFTWFINDGTQCQCVTFRVCIMDSLRVDDFQNFLKTVFWVVFGIFLANFANNFYKKLKIIKAINKFPGPPVSSWLWGNWDLLTQPTDKLNLSLRSMAKKFYPHYGMRILYNCAVSIVSPEDCEIIMGTKKHTTKSEVYVILINWLKDGLLLSKGEKWLTRRKILTPAFHFNILKDFLGTFNEETEKLIEIVSKKCSEPIDVVPLVSDFALYSINETAMGHKLNPQNKEQKEYRDAIIEVEDIFISRLMRPWLYIPAIYIFSSEYRKEKRLLKTLHQFTRKVIRERLSSFKGISEFEEHKKELGDDNEDIYMGKKKKRLAMLDVLLQAHKDGGQIDYEGICEEVDTFMFEGHDTTGAALGFCLMLIANHPEIQENIHKEIKSVLGEKIRHPTYNDLQKMDLLDRCIKESLRLYPSVHFVSRLIDEDTTLNSGMVLPKHSKVHIHIFDVHRNPEIYPDPEKFDPDRFLPENCQHRHPYAYIPFSAGPRNCIGQRFAMLEMKTLLTGILQRFKLIAVDTPDTIVLKLEMVLRTTKGIKVKFDPRN